MSRLRTRTAIVAVVMALAAGGCNSGDKSSSNTNSAPKELQKITFVTGFGILGQDAFMFLGQDKGYFRDAGFEVDIKPGAGTGENLKNLLGGQADFAVLDLTGAIIALGKGQAKDFTIVAAIYQRTVSCIMSLDGMNVLTPKDLEGKKVGYQPGGVNYTLFPTYAQLAGIDASKVQWVVLPPQQIVPALVTHQVDAITQTVVAKPQVEAAAQGKKSVILAYSDFLTDLYGNALGVSSKTARENPEMVKRFRDALLKSLEYASDHPDEAGKAMANHQKQYKAEVATAEFTLAVPYIRSAGSGQPVGALVEQRVARNIAILQGAGAIGSGITPEQIVSFDLAPKG